MVEFGYTLMTEQAGPRDLVRHAAGAERAGFAFEGMSEHYFPWLGSQGHPRPSAGGPAGGAGGRAAPVVLWSGTRSAVVRGAGDNGRGRVVAGGGPPVNVRHEMLA